jgi:hypothetical protein
MMLICMNILSTIKYNILYKYLKSNKRLKQLAKLQVLENKNEL